MPSRWHSTVLDGHRACADYPRTAALSRPAIVAFAMTTEDHSYLCPAVAAVPGGGSWARFGIDTGGVDGIEAARRGRAVDGWLGDSGQRSRY